MASTKSGRNALPKRFRGLFDQAATETSLRYGSQEDALGALLDRSTTNYRQQAQAQSDAGRSLLGSLTGASNDLNRVYSDAGLTPTLLAQIGNSPTGQRLAAELARGQAGIQQQQLGAQTGQQYIQKSLYDAYKQDADQIGGQVSSLAKEKGLYQGSLLDQLITGDRSARHTANEAARSQAHADAQATLNRTATQDNALIGQGLLPGADGVLQPLPGGKADPNAPANQPKRTTGAGTASPDAQRSAGTDFSKALGLAKGLTRGQGGQQGLREGTTNILTNGKPASAGQPIYDEVPVLDVAGRPKVDGKGKPVTKQVKRLNPDGTPATTKGRPAVPSFDQPIAAAATEQALLGYVTTKTVRALQTLGYSVNQIPGLKTETQYRQSRPKSTTPPSVTRPTATTRDQQPG